MRARGQRVWAWKWRAAWWPGQSACWCWQWGLSWEPNSGSSGRCSCLRWRVCSPRCSGSSLSGWSFRGRRISHPRLRTAHPHAATADSLNTRIRQITDQWFRSIARRHGVWRSAPKSLSGVLLRQRTDRERKQTRTGLRSRQGWRDAGRVVGEGWGWVGLARDNTTDEIASCRGAE